MIGEKDKCWASADYQTDYQCGYTHKPCVGARFYGLNKNSLGRCPMYHISIIKGSPNINITLRLVHDVVASAREKMQDIESTKKGLEAELSKES